MPTRRDFLKQSVLLGTGLGLAGAGYAVWRDPRWFAAAQDGPVKAGRVVLEEGQLAPGTSIDLTGQWLFKPSYLIAPSQAPEAAAADDGYVEVGVPQLLNRVRWWLDDSEDFDRFEQERLGRLGFDTERSDDGWYRLEIDVPDLPAGRRIFAEFDGVAMVSKAFLNGQPLGDHEGMFSRFGYDLTPHLQPGRNVLAMYVSMEKIPPSRVDMGAAVTVNLTASKVMTMSKGMYGPLSPDADNRAYDLYGIWQPVRLVMRGSAKIDDAWFNPSLQGADVQVEVHSLGDPTVGVLEVEWTDRQTGEAFATAGPREVKLGNETIGYALHLRDVAPKHWTPADPNLYRMVVSLKSRSGELLDRVTHDVGFRTFEVRGNQLHLNGRPYWLRGADHLPYGKNPWDPDLPRKLIQLMHDGHQRVTRTHATPWNEAWLNAADEIGLGVSIEGIRPWALVGNIGLPPAEIFQHWLMEHEDMVRRCRNHPSVFIWTIGNEMLLRDRENVEKWKLLSEVVKLTRRLDPSRPTICSSTYQRDPEFYEQVLKPNGIDDGDIDDIHRYNGWYGDSNFVQDSKFEREMERNGGSRPFIGQEMSTGYPNLDNGLPVAHYTSELVVPQAWVGYNAYPGSDPAVYLNDHRAVTKRWAEQLRFQRGDRTAGFMMFAAECWYSHSYDPDRVEPYPVYEAMQQAWAPVGLALKTPRRRFHAGEEVATSIFVTNDDERFRDHANLTLQVGFVDEADRPVADSATVGEIGEIAYYQSVEVPVRIPMPEIGAPRQRLRMVTRLLENGEELSRTVDPVELFRADAFPAEPTGRSAVALSVGPELGAFIDERRIFSRVDNDLPDAQPEAAVVLLGPGHPLDELAPGRPVRRWIENGATAIVFSPGKEAAEVLPGEIDRVRMDVGEYADPVPAAGTKLAEHLQPMDLKWWGRKDDERAFIAGEYYLLSDGAHARELIRFIPSHGYISEEKVPGMFRTVLFELRMGRGRLWMCGLDLEASVSVDPAAALFARNLLRAAADPLSTDHLPEVPSHEQMMAGTRPSPRLSSTPRTT